NSTTVLPSNGQYVWETNLQANDTGSNGTAGVDWDLLSLQTVSVTAGNTNGTKFVIKVIGLAGAWNANIVSKWKIATFTSGITSAILDRFTIDTSQWGNSIGAGGLFLEVNGNELD